MQQGLKPFSLNGIDRQILLQPLFKLILGQGPINCMLGPRRIGVL